MNQTLRANHLKEEGSPKTNKPERKIRSGPISATIWLNEQESATGKIAYKTVSFERSYKDKAGQWKSTNRLRANDIPRAVLVLNEAYKHLALGEEQQEQRYETI